jgi:FkbM family methyltransferase
MLRSAVRRRIDQFPALSRFVHGMRDIADRGGPLRPTPWGFRLAGHEAMASGSFEPAETLVVRRLLERVDVLVNVGANVGYYCCHALSLGKSVIAIEPMPRNVHYLLRNIRENGWSERAEVFPIAVGPKTDLLPMYGGGTGASLVRGWAGVGEHHLTIVPVHALDRILGTSLVGRRALVLVDVEGAEFPMLLGASATLSGSPRPIWMIEISRTEHRPADEPVNPDYERTFELMRNAGYRHVRASELLGPDVPELASHNHLFV